MSIAKETVGEEKYFTTYDVLTILGLIQKAIENTKGSMGKGLNAEDVRVGDCFRSGKLAAYRYVKARVLATARWKGMDLNDY